MTAETAAGHLVDRIATARSDESVGAVRAALFGRALDDAGSIYLVDDAGRLLGLVPLTAVLAATPDLPIGELAMGDFRGVAHDADQEAVATLAIENEITAVPVVGADGRLEGVVPPSAIFRILRREHDEDLHRLAGIRHDTLHARETLEGPALVRAGHRLPWLFVGLAGSMVATWIMARFERALEARIAVAFFVPGIVYLADAIGTQTEAIAVRGLSLVHRPLRTLVGGEMLTGLVIGLVLGAIVFPAVALAFGDVRLALAVALSVVAAGTVATSVGLLFPWILSRLGSDPAYGSGPVATIVQDVLSILVYFAIVTALW